MRRVQLPEQPITAAIIGERYRSLLEQPLAARGISVLWLPDNPCIDPRLAGHVDLSVFPLTADRFLLASYLKEKPLFVKSLTNRGISVVFSELEQTARYPQDANCNACHFGDTVIWNPKTADPQILAALGHCRQIPVKQGYTNCTVVPVSETGIITDDAGIATAAKRAGLDVLQVRSGFVALPGFDTGFLGGACCLSAPDTLLMTGSLRHHPDEKVILEFLKRNQIETIDCLTDLPIFDIGSILGF